MSVPANYLPEAEDDVVAAHTYYEGQRPGLGDEFVDAVRIAVDEIRDHPHMYCVLYRDIRAVTLRRFPYVVYYRDRVTDILIVAIQHGRRSSRVWRGRI